MTSNFFAFYQMYVFLEYLYTCLLMLYHTKDDVSLNMFYLTIDRIHHHLLGVFV